jgi:simple sugar transport system ATP-binding protein
MGNTIKLKNISKSFGTIQANKNVSLTIKPGEILSVLGENGSGKTTLMNMLAGIYYPDSGEIDINGKKVTIASPKDAYDHGIGMVHQHFKLVDVFSASQNIILGLREGFMVNLKKVDRKVSEIAQKYGFSINPRQKVYDMSVSQKQTVEIIKLLYRGVDTLILDEPTAVLTPQETDKLFEVLRQMKANGKAVVIITHKLNEVLSLSDRVAILRKGQVAKVIETKDANEAILTDLMVGEHIDLKIDRSAPMYEEKVLEVKNLTTYDDEGVKTLDNVSFDSYTGEILGIAGVSGSGQKALLEAISGLQKCQSGSSILFLDKGSKVNELVGKTPKAIKRLGVRLAFVPEDRLGMGLVGDMGMTDNMLLRSYEKGNTPFLETRKPHETAVEVKDELAVLTPSLDTPVRKLSGGNVQKVLVGREIASSPRLLLTAYATRGLDINTSYVIYNILNEQKKKGVAVVYVGEDLDVLLALTDRIMVLCDGHVTGIVDTRTTDKRTIGALMSTVQTQKEAK